MEIGEIDALEVKEKAEEMELKKEEEEHHKEHRLNMRVALTIALLATFMGICKVKNDGIIQTMQKVQADKLDSWAWYQSRHIRADVFHATAVQMQLNAKAVPAMKKDYEDQATVYENLAKKEQDKMTEQQKQGEEAQKAYDELHERNDQFDMTEAGLTIAIAILAITSLTQLVWMYWLSLIPAGFGILIGLSGLFHWAIHIEWLTKLMGS